MKTLLLAAGILSTSVFGAGGILTFSISKNNKGAESAVILSEEDYKFLLNRLEVYELVKIPGLKLYAKKTGKGVFTLDGIQVRF